MIALSLTSGWLGWGLVLGCPSTPVTPEVETPTTEETGKTAIEDSGTMDTTPADTSGENPSTADTSAPVSCPECIWVTSSWDECSVACGPVEGLETRTVTCETPEGKPVPDADCDPATRPADERACTAAEDCSWATGEFGACSSTCGDGTATRIVYCEDSDGTYVLESWCDPALRPDDSQVCSDTATCGWDVSAFGACSSTCGSGTRDRTVECVDTATGAPVAEALCTTAKPATTENCTETTTCAWDTGAFGSCNTNCGNGQQTRPVTCQDTATGALVSEALCGGLARPTDSQSCTATASCAWSTGSFGSCSTACGNGMQSRSVSCVNTDIGATVADNFCTDPRPSGSQPCSATAACTWATGAYGVCSNTCGDGSRTRSVDCVDPGGAVLTDDFCTATRPDDSEACFETADCVWSVGSYGACSPNCQSGGTQTRSVTCRDTTNASVNDAWCPSPKPTTSQACIGTGTPGTWQTGPWGFCNYLTCEETRSVTCPSACGCTGSRPASSQPCSNGFCNCGGVGQPACP